jgi:hypothetical protein
MVLRTCFARFSDFLFCVLYIAMLENFRGPHKFSDCYSSWMQHMTKDILSTKITKATKGSDILLINFVLFVSSVVKFVFSVAALPR